MENDTISASRVAAMLGMDERCSPLSLYLQMRGEMPGPEDNEVLKEGRYFEDAIARIASEKYGFELDLDAPLELKNDVLIGHPDRWFGKGDDYGVLEIKNTLYGEVGSGGWGDPGTDQVPKGYWLQAQVYCYLATKSKGAVGERCADYALLAARLRGGVQLYKIPLDLQVIERVKEEARAFLQRVRDGVPPDPQDEADARNRWLVTPKKEVEISTDDIAVLRSIVEAKRQIKQLEQFVSDKQFYLLSRAQDGELLVHTDKDGVKKTYASLSANRKFDEAACLAEFPEALTKWPKLDVSRLAREDRVLHERYMKRAENPVEQTRVIRIREKELE